MWDVACMHCHHAAQTDDAGAAYCAVMVAVHAGGMPCPRMCNGLPLQARCIGGMNVHVADVALGRPYIREDM